MANRIFVTGDCHGEFRKFSNDSFPEQRLLDKQDYMIICGDFGGLWNVGWENKKEKYWLDWLEQRKFTTLIVDGNHENYDRLYSIPVETWMGGKIRRIRPSVIHMMRGQIFEIAQKSIFTFGGARSHDIADGILDVEDKDFKVKKKQLDESYGQYRIKHLTWWEEELGSAEEFDEASNNLEKRDFQVDFIITHCCASSTQQLISENFETDPQTDFFEIIKNTCKYDKWYFGHYHYDKDVSDTEVVLYDRIIELGSGADD